MRITEIQLDLEKDHNRLLAFCSIVIDGEFIIRDIKIINGKKGIFISMPSRKIDYHCSACHNTNPIVANYCSYCGVHLNNEKAIQESQDCNGRPKLYADIAHPITSNCRDKISKAILEAYKKKQKD